MADKKDVMLVSVWRQSPDQAGDYQTFEVPRQESQTVLDVVTYIQHNLDPTLTYRFACRVGMCGSCAMMVNDEPRWTCRTHVQKVAVDGELKISPLRNLPVIKDLAAEGRTMLIVTHDMKLAADVSDHVVFLHQGLIEERRWINRVYLCILVFQSGLIYQSH